MKLSSVLAYGILLPGILAGAAAVQAAPPVTVAHHTNPADPQMWVTMDARELDTLRAGMSRKELARMPRTLEVYDGVAMAVTTESGLEDLAIAVHGKLDRCAGFVAHTSPEEAEQFLYAPITAPRILAVDYSIDRQTEVRATLAQVAPANVAATIRTLSNYPTRYYQNQTGQDAAVWLQQRWTQIAAGRTDVRVERFNHAAWLQDSVIATITGTQFPTEVIVLGGHLDSIRSRGGSSAQCTTTCTAASCPAACRAPGADDDASGIASLTETYRAMIAAGFRPARTIKFMAYAAEEVGLRGSQEIARTMIGQGVNVVGVLQYDMTNFKNGAANAVDVGILADRNFTNPTQNAFLRRLLTTYLPELTVNATTTCGYGCSDHASWSAQGVPASIAFEARFGQQSPNAHSAADTFTRPNTDTTGAIAAKFSRLGAAYLIELGKGAITPRTR